MEKVTFVEKDQNWQEQRTNYWFMVDGESYGVCESFDGDVTVLDGEGYPMNTEGQELDNLKDYVTDEMRSEA